MLQIPYTAQVTNKRIKDQIDTAIGTSERLLEIVKYRQLQWFGHQCRQDDNLAKMIMEEREDGKRRRSRPEKQWIEDIMEWEFWSMMKLWKKRETENSRDLLS